jgi:hypothetical protein
MKPKLHLVESGPEPSEARILLSQIVPTVAMLEKTLARMRHHQTVWSRQLADERGVAFIREEQLRQEFGQ